MAVGNLLYSFDPSKGETPETIARRRQTADLIAARIFGKAPANVGEGLNAIGQALIARQMQSEATDAQAAGMASVPALFGGTGANPAANIAASIVGQPVTPSAAVASSPMGDIPPPAVPTTGKIYSNDEPSPLDPPSGQDRQAMIATILGEAGNQGPTGMNAVGSVIRNRAVSGSFGGDTPTGVVTAKNQFEPWNTPEGRARMARAAADPRQAAAADAAISAAYGEGGQAPNDPTNGATMFFDPKLQASLGRNVPPWAQGPGQDIGDHRFFGGAPMQPTQVADAGSAIPPAPMSGGMIGSAPPDQRQAMAFAGPTVPQPLANPAGAPPAATANDGEDALPANAAPAQGALPTAQAVQAATPGAGGPFPNVSTEDLTKYAMNQFVPAANRQVIAAEITRRATAAQQANDPAHQLDIQAKQLAVKKAQQDSEKSDFEWKPVGRDANGQWSYGWVNSKTQEVRDRNGKPMEQGQQPTEDATAGLMGDDYLKAIPRDRADIARKVANGEIDVTSLPNRGNYRMQVLSDAARFDPTFNPADYKTRLATRRDFTSGKSAQNITSFNTAIGHLDTLDKAIDPLGNRSSSLYNWATAPISEQTDPKYQVALKEFRTAKQAVADELSRAFKGAGGTVHDISEWEKTINSADSPAALHAAAKQAVELLHSRINAVGDQYNRGMGKTTDPVSLLSPKARATLERLEGGARPQETPTAPQGKTSSGISWSIQ